MAVTMTVAKADDGTHGTAIGQVFASKESKPLAEMYHSRDEEIVVGVKKSPTEDQIITKVGSVPVGTKFDFIMSYSKYELSVSINGVKTVLSTQDWKNPNCYFKTGNYNQGKSADDSEVHISAITVSHS